MEIFLEGASKLITEAKRIKRSTLNSAPPGRKARSFLGKFKEVWAWVQGAPKEHPRDTWVVVLQDQTATPGHR